MEELFELSETEKVVQQSDNSISNKLLYLKLEIDKQYYLIMLSEIVEIKKTNVITPLATTSAQKQKIFGMLYYQHEIIPVYKLNLRRNPNNTNFQIEIPSSEVSRNYQKKYQDVLIIRTSQHIGILINNMSRAEIVDINFTRSNDTLEDFEIIDIKDVLSLIKI